MDLYSMVVDLMDLGVVYKTPVCQDRMEGGILMY
jgi:hypothetical protein